MAARTRDSHWCPCISRASSNTQPVQRGRDLFVRKDTSHLSDHLDRFETRASAVSASFTFVYSQFGVSSACPVNYQDDFPLLVVHVCDNLLDQDPHDSLLHTHVRRWRIPDGR